MVTISPAQPVIDVLRQARMTIAVAESLTGGALCATLIDVPGASQVVRGGVCTYATDTKASILGVDQALLRQRGAVDPEVAQAMAEGVCTLFHADLGVATTGVAGPEPQDGHPVGQAYIAVAGSTMPATVIRVDAHGSRDEIRRECVTRALPLLRDISRNFTQFAPRVDASSDDTTARTTITS